MQIKKSTAKHIGFFSALSVLIGSVVGIGIFFKNGSVFIANNYNGVGVLVSWILAAVIATTTAFSFAEISSSKTSKAGLAEWSEKFGGKRFGYFVKLALPLFYFGVLLPGIFIFTSESIFNIFDVTSSGFVNNVKENVHIVWVFVLAFVIFIIILFTNVKYKRISQKSQLTLTIAKFLPLVATIIIGFIFFSTKGNNLFVGLPPSAVSEASNINNEPKPIDFTGILSSLPAILFAFDSFLSVGSLSKEMKNGEKKIPIVIVVGMIFCSVLYILITISQILIGEGIIGSFYNTIFQDNATLSFAFELIIDIFMFVSILGVANGLTMASLRNFDYIVSNKLVFKHEKIKYLGRKHDLLSGAILLFIVFSFWFLIMLVPSSILNSDVLVDGMSNYPTLFFFCVYGAIVLLGIINRKTKKVKVRKIKLFIPIALISLIGIFITFGYQIFYENLAKLIIDPNTKLSWGVLFSHGKELLIWEGAIIFFVSLISFFSIPYINSLLFRIENINNKKILKREIKKYISSRMET